MKSKLPIVKGPVKVESLAKVAPVPKGLLNSLAFPKDFKAAAVVDKKGTPKYFIFDAPSLWDMLCVIDARLEESVSAKEYVFRNPVGWLIDAIEGSLPLNPNFVSRLKKGIEEAKRLGLVPFEEIQRKLKLS